MTDSAHRNLLVKCAKLLIFPNPISSLLLVVRETGVSAIWEVLCIKNTLGLTPGRPPTPHICQSGFCDSQCEKKKISCRIRNSSSHSPPTWSYASVYFKVRAVFKPRSPWRPSQLSDPNRVCAFPRWEPPHLQTLINKPFFSPPASFVWQPQTNRNPLYRAASRLQLDSQALGVLTVTNWRPRYSLCCPERRGTETLNYF